MRYLMFTFLVAALTLPALACDPGAAPDGMVVGQVVDVQNPEETTNGSTMYVIDIVHAEPISLSGLQEFWTPGGAYSDGMSVSEEVIMPGWSVSTIGMVRDQWVILWYHENPVEGHRVVAEAWTPMLSSLLPLGNDNTKRAAAAELSAFLEDPETKGEWDTSLVLFKPNPGSTIRLLSAIPDNTVPGRTYMETFSGILYPGSGDDDAATRSFAQVKAAFYEARNR